MPSECTEPGADFGDAIRAPVQRVTMKAQTRNSKFGEAWLLAAALAGPVILAACSANQSRSAPDLGAGAGATSNGGSGHPDGGGSAAAGGLGAGYAGQTSLGGGASTGG